MSDKINWLDAEFTIGDLNTKWKDIPGIYIFCSINAQNQWTPIYVGQASSLHDRISSHDRLDEARRLGCKSIHAKVVENQAQRDLLEKRLIQAFQPPLNTQLK